MSITKEFDTITAISTPLGEGAIGIVRLSGTDAVAIANKVFKGKNLESVTSHTINYGHIVENDETIDEVMVDVYKRQNTFASKNCKKGKIKKRPVPLFYKLLTAATAAS